MLACNVFQSQTPAIKSVSMGVLLLQKTNTDVVKNVRQDCDTAFLFDYLLLANKEHLSSDRKTKTGQSAKQRITKCAAPSFTVTKQKEQLLRGEKIWRL